MVLTIPVTYCIPMHVLSQISLLNTYFTFHGDDHSPCLRLWNTLMTYTYSRIIVRLTNHFQWLSQIHSRSLKSRALMALKFWLNTIPFHLVLWLASQWPILGYGCSLVWSSQFNWPQICISVELSALFWCSNKTTSFTDIQASTSNFHIPFDIVSQV